MIKPFFTFYGGKHRVSGKYPIPKHSNIIEPFAGSAGYSCRYDQHQITLVEKDEKIFSLWKYLINVTQKEIRSLPLLIEGSVEDLNICQEAKYLIGFWLNKGAAQPCKTPSSWMRGGLRPNSFWGENISQRIANQVDKIRHWKIILGDYSLVENYKATWFIDPPYILAGNHYKHGSKSIDFVELSRWCKSRIGQTIVCENEGAEWLDFQPFETIKSNPSARGKSYSKEVIWIDG